MCVFINWKGFSRERSGPFVPCFPGTILPRFIFTFFFKKKGFIWYKTWLLNSSYLKFGQTFSKCMQYIEMSSLQNYTIYYLRMRDFSAKTRSYCSTILVNLGIVFQWSRKLPQKIDFLKRPTGLNCHLSIRYFTLTSCQKGSYWHKNSPIIE